MTHDYEYDFFISHASEDKDDFVRPLAYALIEKGYSVWYDELTLTIGDSLRKSIDTGLLKSRFGIVVLSPNFFKKDWPEKELDGLTAKEVAGVKVILPVWHKVSRDDVLQFSPMLAGLLAARTAHNLDSVVAEIEKAFSSAAKNIATQGQRDLQLGIEQTTSPDRLPEFLDTTNNDMEQYGWIAGEAYKQALIYPADSEPLAPYKKLEEIVDTLRVDIKDWGGYSFPQIRSGSSKQILRHQNGLALVDNDAQITENWAFHYWFISRNLYFLQRDNLIEDHSSDFNGYGKVIEVSWILMDIVRPVLFSSRLLGFEFDINKLQVQLDWFGMRERALIDISKPSRFRNFACSEDRIQLQFEINRNSNLLSLCLNEAINILWLFGHTRPEKEASDQMSLLLNEQRLSGA